MPPHYEEWLTHVFDRPVTDPPWHFDFAAPTFDAPEDATVSLLIHTFEQCGSDLARFSNAQVNQGLKYLFSSGCSDFLSYPFSDSVPLSHGLEAISAIRHLYRDCFEQRCAPVLGHLNEPGAKPLNYICFMLWDCSDLTNLTHAKRDAFFDVMLDVMQVGLACRNPACVESALHGLGHLHLDRGSEVEEIVRAFLADNPQVRPELKQYANDAAVGYVQ